MEPLKNPSIPEMLSFLMKKYSIQDKDLSFLQEILMGREENFKIEMENAKKNFEEEKKGIDGRYKKIIADRMEDCKEETQVLYKRINELKMEKGEVENRLGFFYEKLIELNGRLSRLKEEMKIIGEVQFNSAKNCSCKSGNEEPLPINLDSERGDPTINSSACKAIKCFKNNLNAVSDKQEYLPVIVISNNDDDLDTNKLASASNPCGLCGSITCSQKKKEVHVQGSSNLIKKKKRSMNEGENRDGSSSKIARVVPCPGQNSVFIRRCEEKVGFKNHSELPLRISDKPYQFGNGNDSCSTRKVGMSIKEGRKWLSEDDLCTTFEEDPELCLNAVCALYRQQISENKSSYFMSQIDEMSITALGNYLIDGDAENKLRRAMSEVSLEEQVKCRRLAIRYSHLLFQTYHSKNDRLFCHGAGIL